jgi:hypothetical protein
MFFPDYFKDRAKKWLELAKRIRDPALAQTFADRAQILTRTAIEAERVLALQDRTENLTFRTDLSKARTLSELRRDLETLSAGMSLHLKMRDYLDLFSPPDDGWKASTRLSEEFGCSAEFRPDGCMVCQASLTNGPAVRVIEVRCERETLGSTASCIRQLADETQQCAFSGCRTSPISRGPTCAPSLGG